MMKFAPILSNYAGKLISKGNFYPATSTNARLEEYQAFKKGVFVCLNLNQFYGDYATLFNSAANIPIGLNQGLNYDTDSWATTLYESGVKYAVFTVMNEFGFQLWPSNVQWPIPTQNITNSILGAFSSPAHRKYNVNVNGSVNRNLVDSFCVSMRKRKIEPIAYIDISDSFNHIGGNIVRVDISVKTTWAYYCALCLQELILKYKLRYVWLDNYGNTGDANMQLLYNAVKSVSTDCLVIASQNSSGFAGGFPCDICTIEEYYLTNPATQLATTRAHNGVNYYTPVEVATTTCTNEQYYYFEPTKPHSATQDPQLKLRDLSTLQANYTSYKDTYGANYLLGITPQLDGTFQTAQTDLVKNIL